MVKVSLKPHYLIYTQKNKLGWLSNNLLVWFGHDFTNYVHV